MGSLNFVKDELIMLIKEPVSLESFYSWKWVGLNKS